MILCLATYSPSTPPADTKQRYIFADAIARETKDPVVLRDELLSLVVAGRDSTAGLLSYLFALLARHPDKYQKLRTEILEIFGPYSEGPHKRISFEALKNCLYLQYCIKEALRLFPLVPANNREAICDTMLPKGGGPDGQGPVFVEKGMLIQYCTSIMHRRKDLWGEDADEFRPERWEKRKTGWDYIPFNGGPRICIGQQFALTEAGYVIVRLLQRFDRIDGSKVAGTKILTELSVVAKVVGGVHLRMHEASA